MVETMVYQDKNGKCYDMNEYINNMKKDVRVIYEKAILKQKWLIDIENKNIREGNE